MRDQDRPQKPAEPRQPEGAPRPHHIADEPVAKPAAPNAGRQSPTTETGLSVEEQVRKEWDAKRKGGLPTSLPAGRS